MMVTCSVTTRTGSRHRYWMEGWMDGCYIGQRAVVVTVVVKDGSKEIVIGSVWLI